MRRPCALCDDVPYTMSTACLLLEPAPASTVDENNAGAVSNVSTASGPHTSASVQCPGPSAGTAGAAPASDTPPPRDPGSDTCVGLLPFDSDGARLVRAPCVGGAARCVSGSEEGTAEAAAAAANRSPSLPMAPAGRGGVAPPFPCTDDDDDDCITRSSPPHGAPAIAVTPMRLAWCHGGVSLPKCLARGYVQDCGRRGMVVLDWCAERPRAAPCKRDDVTNPRPGPATSVWTVHTRHHCSRS